MAASSSSSSSPRWIYDVFLSFRGEDTRCGFVSHLYTALDRKGINCYKDDDTLKRGLEISPELLKAIESSRCAIVVFSESYASSRWCLDELMKILQCRREMGQTVLPIFYHVEPTDVRKPKAFPKTAQVEEDLQRWKAALTEASNIAGLSTHQERSESVLVEMISNFIFDKLNSVSKTTTKELVGIDSRVEEINSLLCSGKDDVRFVGIWGMGGIGKTTLAQVVYWQIRNEFDAYCFLANVKDSNLVSLQEKLLSKVRGGTVSIETPSFGANFIQEWLRFRKVLIVLDDVDDLKQLEMLAGDCNWFGCGSRILITTRDERLLIAHNVQRIYKAKELNQQEAVELFCSKAFGTKHPPDDFSKLSDAVIKYAKGLPLALEVLGSCLYKRGTNEWEDTLCNLKNCPDEKIQRVLKISYDALHDRLKNLFLDIACLFNGGDKDYIFRVLECCDFLPLHFNLLTEKSLITIQDNKVLMHDLLQEMGRDIVYQESPEQPGKRSRLWIHDDVSHVLAKNLGTEAVKGIVFDLYGLKEHTFNSQAFVKMNNLRLLKICYTQSPAGFDYLSKQEQKSRKWPCVMPNDLDSLKDCKVRLLGSFEVISDRLGCLHWFGFPLKSLPSRFHPKNLVELNMCYSNIRQLWKGSMDFKMLRYMKLSYSTNLTKTPDFGGAPNLERLILEGCTNLVEVHPSLGVLKKLILLNMKDCKKLRHLPRVIEWDSLKYLYLKGCKKLTKFPETARPMQYLQELYLEGTSFKRPPLSIKYITCLVELSLGECKHLESLPGSICELHSLQELTLCGCSKLRELPEELGRLSNLKTLAAGRTAISKLPSSIVLLENLDALLFEGIDHERSNLHQTPFSSLLSRGKDQSPRTLDLSPISRLSSLRQLNISGYDVLMLPDDIGCLSFLEDLYLPQNNISTLPSTIGGLPRLQSLYLEGCERLQALPQLPSTLEYLFADNCTSLEILPKTSSPKYNYCRFSNCSKLVENQEADDLVTVLLQNILRVPNPKPAFDFIIPGREIPKWFCDHQNMGDTVSVQLPPSWHDNVTGIAMCVVFESRDGNHELGPNPNEKHLWVGYLEFHTSLGFQVYYAQWDAFTEISVSFESNHPDCGYVIEQCAARLVHAEYVYDQWQETLKFLRPAKPHSVFLNSFGDIFSIVQLSWNRVDGNVMSWRLEQSLGGTTIIAPENNVLDVNEDLIRWAFMRQETIAYEVGGEKMQDV